MSPTVRLTRPIGALGALLLLTAIPLALWHRVLHDVLVSFHWSLSYAAAELGPWLLLLAGILFLIPVAVSSGLDPESRLYPRGRRAYFIWGVVLYMLGAILAIELFEVWAYAH
ncbi:MAG TPA: hypothetical protein VG325_04430 [Solirubrobacteraceae bacterium]|nr:hypothetical protein [Solirubrobacteraceae bacterium]